MINVKQFNFAKRLTTITIMIFLMVVNMSCDKTQGELQLIPADPEKGFNFPYFLFLPEEGLNSNKITFIIEPNNTGFVADNIDEHIDAAKQQARSSQIGNYLSHKLNYPLLVPAFPRSEENWKVYTHALDRDALLQKGNPVGRLDLQLIAMFKDAKQKLSEMGYDSEEKFIMTGFSACASFSNRFAALHPHKVKSYVAGGLNGMLILPERKINGTTLPYPIGIGDLQSLTGQPFDSTSFKGIPQFLFMGEEDDNDAANYDDAYDNTEREIIYKILGEKMLPDRWNFCIASYQKHNVNVTARLYPKTGHEITREIQDDILSFIKTSVKNEVE